MAIQQLRETPATKGQKMLLLLFCAALPFLYSAAGVDPSLIPRQIGASVWVLVLSAWLYWQQRKDAVKLNSIPLVLGLWVCTYAVSYVQAINTVEAVYIILKMGLFAAIGLIAYVLTQKGVLTLRWLSLCVSVAGIIATLLVLGNLFLLQQQGVKVFERDNMYLVNATFGHKNLLSSFLFVCAPMYVVQLVDTRHKSWKAVLVLMGILLVAMLILLQTRAVLLAGLVCALAACVLLVSAFGKQLSLWQKRWSIALLASSLIVAVIVIDGYRDKLTLLTRTESFKERKNLWDNTLQMISDHPIAGVGAANWQIWMPKYGMQKFYEVNYTISEGLTNFQRPHNDFLWVWSETGILGLLCYLFLFTATLVVAYRLLKHAERIQEKIGYAMVFLQVLGFGVISAVDFPLERIEHPAMIMLSVGLIAASRDKLHNQRSLSCSRWIWFLPAAVALLSLFVCAKRWQSELQLRKMYKAHATGNWQRLIAEGKKAQTPYFNMDYYSIPIQWYVGVGYFMQENLAAAKSNFEAAYQLHPYQVHVLNNYGTCYEKEGNHTRAIELLEASHRLSPTFSDGIINLSGAYFNAGRYDDAYATITQFRYDEQNERFKTFALAIIKVKLDAIITREKTTPFATYLKRLVSDDKAMLDAYKQAQKQGDTLLAWLEQQSRID